MGARVLPAPHPRGAAHAPPAEARLGPQPRWASLGPRRIALPARGGPLPPKPRHVASTAGAQRANAAFDGMVPRGTPAGMSAARSLHPLEGLREYQAPLLVVAHARTPLPRRRTTCPQRDCRRTASISRWMNSSMSRSNSPGTRSLVTSVRRSSSSRSASARSKISFDPARGLPPLTRSRCAASGTRTRCHTLSRSRGSSLRCAENGSGTRRLSTGCPATLSVRTTCEALFALGKTAMSRFGPTRRKSTVSAGPTAPSASTSAADKLKSAPSGNCTEISTGQSGEATIASCAHASSAELCSGSESRPAGRTWVSLLSSDPPPRVGERSCSCRDASPPPASLAGPPCELVVDVSPALGVVSRSASLPRKCSSHPSFPGRAERTANPNPAAPSAIRPMARGMRLTTPQFAVARVGTKGADPPRDGDQTALHQMGH
jgi:hypothetical protein